MAATEIIDLGNIDLIEVHYSIGGERYILKEATGDAVCKYRNRLLDSTVIGENGKPTQIKGIADTEPMLVSLCLYDANGKLVPAEKIRSWPGRIQSLLFDKAKEISNLGESPEEKSKSKESAKNG